MKLLIELMLLGCSEYSARLRAKSIKHHRYAKWEQHLDRTYNKQSRYGEMFDIFHGARMMPSATAAGEPSSGETEEQRISRNRREQKGRRLLAAGSGLCQRIILASLLECRVSPVRHDRSSAARAVGPDVRAFAHRH